MERLLSPANDDPMCSVNATPPTPPPSAPPPPAPPSHTSSREDFGQPDSGAASLESSAVDKLDSLVYSREEASRNEETVGSDYVSADSYQLVDESLSPVASSACQKTVPPGLIPVSPSHPPEKDKLIRKSFRRRWRVGRHPCVWR